MLGELCGMTYASVEKHEIWNLQHQQPMLHGSLSQRHEVFSNFWRSRQSPDTEGSCEYIE